MEWVGREWNRVKGRLLWELMESVTLATNCIPWKQLLSELPRAQGLAGSLATSSGLENSGPRDTRTTGEAREVASSQC
jgi:hypothetical protein